MSYVDRNSKLECELATNVPSWTLFRLMPNQLQVMDVIKQQNEDEKFEFEMGGEWIVDDVQVGENIVVCFR